VRRLAAAVLLLPLLAPAGPAGGQEKVIDVRAVRPPGGNTFQALWAGYRRAEGDADKRKALLEEIRRLRVERNVRSLEVIALGLVAQGLERLGRGDRAAAEADLRAAIGLDPHLPDAYFGLAKTQARKGPLGLLPAARDTLAGVSARLPTARGRFNAVALLVPALLLALFGSATAFAVAMVLRHGTLLRHDLEERLGQSRGRLIATAVFAALLLLPVVTFQGYGWLPLWWLALLFVYLSRAEQLVAAGLLLCALAVGPLVKTLERRILAYQNPLCRAALLAVEAESDTRAISELEAAVAATRDDHDLVYLLATHYKKAGRYDEAASLYRELLRQDANDSVSLNNLANLEFARGEFQAAIARYQQGIQSTPPAAIAATFFYNLSQAHLQRFEYQPAQEARSQADRLDARLTGDYEEQWRYDRGENAVVDLGLSGRQVWQKFDGRASGPGEKNVARQPPPSQVSGLLEATFNRFAAFLPLAAMVSFGIVRWRGSRTFTMRCLKCGTPFCKRCHLGAAAGGLCTQCHHLFVVRDGVSGPARNQKLLEVQKEDERRERVFRVLSLVSPGAGHLYANKTVAGLLFAIVWYALLALTFLAGRLVPVTEAASQLTPPWGIGLAGLLLLGTYVVANRARPDFEVMMPVRRTGRRTRA
jgi:tetratricopeptide (TPR) repeat protein